MLVVSKSMQDYYLRIFKGCLQVLQYVKCIYLFHIKFILLCLVNGNSTKTGEYPARTHLWIRMHIRNDETLL